MAKYVGGCGNATAKLMLVGEAPGPDEEDQGIPFVGVSGQLVDQCLNSAGLDRDEVYLTNVVKVRPPNNEIKRLGELGYKIDDFLPQLWAEIREINPNCILAIGNTALKVLTGHDGIQKYRGSILPNCQTHVPKVIPTIHPASMLHAAKEMQNWKVLQYIKFDFRRAAREMLRRELVVPQRNLQVARNSLDLIRFFERYQGHEWMSRDVETFKTIPICVAFAFNPLDAISVGLVNHITPINPDGFPLHDQLYIWRICTQFMGDCKIKLIEQNGKFDDRICHDVGLPGDVSFDTMLAWHTVYPEMPKNLAFITSILTDEPYYKDEGKEYNPKKDKFDKLQIYNCKDAAVTTEIKERELTILKDMGLEDFFWNNMMPLHQLYYDMESDGFLIDEKVRAGLRAKYKARKADVHKKIVDGIFEYSRIPDIDVNVNSPQQVHKLLYQFLSCPLRKDTQESTLNALMNNAIKDQARKGIIQGILEERKVNKTISTYINAAPSEDGRMRTVYKITGTETGRTSTEKREPPVSVTPEGMALQTLTKYGDVGSDLRNMFVADPGHVIVEADGAQAEDRVVAVLSLDWEALKLLEKTDFIYNQYGLKDDRHTLTAMLVTDKAFEYITDEDRQIGKRTRHAANYDVGKHQLMETLAGLEVFVSEWRAGRYLDKIHEANPNIRGVYHQGIIEALERDNCVLTTPFGRRRQFFNKWGRDLFKEAFADIPQSTVTDQVKFAMIRIRRRLTWKPRFLVESHDSFVAMILEEQLTEFTHVSKEELERPINFSRCSLPRDFDLVIPAEFKISRTNWLSMEKYKV